MLCSMVALCETKIAREQASSVARPRDFTLDLEILTWCWRFFKKSGVNRESKYFLGFLTFSRICHFLGGFLTFLERGTFFIFFHSLVTTREPAKCLLNVL